MKIFSPILIAIVAMPILIIFLIDPGINDDEHSKFEDMINGKAYKPFVYRTLLPTSVKIISQTIPVDIKKSLTSTINESILLSKIFLKLRWESRLATEYFIATGLMYLSLLGFAISMKYLFRLFYNVNAIYTNLISIFSLLLLPPFFLYTSFLYDFPNLFLFTLCLIFLKKQKWNIYIPLLIVATLNKETTILLILIFYFYYHNKYPVNKFNHLLISQILVYISVKVMLYLIYKSNPGYFVEFHLIDHNLRLFKHYNLTVVASFLLFIILVFYDWKEKHKYLKISLSMGVPLITLALFLGYIDELRGYYEILPVIIIMIYHNLAKILHLEITAVSESQISSEKV